MTPSLEAVNCNVCPARMDVSPPAVMVIFSNSTLIVIEPLLQPCLEAVIVVLPTATEVTKPLSSTVATFGSFDSQLAPGTDAVNCTFSPKIINPFPNKMNNQ